LPLPIVCYRCSENKGIIIIGAIILFILTLGGLSHQETARRGNYYGMAGMTLAILATIFGPGVTGNIHLIIIAMLIGGTVGITLAKKVAMTQMPELVAILHSLVGVAAVMVWPRSWSVMSLLWMKPLLLQRIWKSPYMK